MDPLASWAPQPPVRSCGDLQGSSQPNGRRVVTQKVEKVVVPNSHCIGSGFRIFLEGQETTYAAKLKVDRG